MGGQPFTKHTDKFVIDDDDMESDTVTESNLSLKSRSFLHRVASTASESPEKTKSESDNVFMSSLNVQQTRTGRPVLAPAHQTTQNGILIKKCLLNLMKCWKQERGDPYMTSLSSMLIWTLAPPQNRTFL